MKVVDKEYFPADLVLLSTTNPEGICYIETMNLDGETNLKMKKALQNTWELKHAVRQFSIGLHQMPLRGYGASINILPGIQQELDKC